MPVEFLETLSDKERYALAEDLYEAMMGGNSIGHTSLVVYACEKHNVPALDWDEALEFCKEMEFEIDECPCCGWVSDGNFYDHPEYAEGVCSDCEVEE